jgi:hypothetical protein
MEIKDIPGLWMGVEKKDESGKEGGFLSPGDNEIEIIGEFCSSNKLDLFLSVFTCRAKEGGDSQKLPPTISEGEKKKFIRRSEMLPPELTPLPGLKHGVRCAFFQEILPFLSEVDQIQRVLMHL